jgi:tryptophanyl-tRNA synthetase
LQQWKHFGGNYGYGHAKQALYELICETLKPKEKNTSITWTTFLK